ncbi:MAG: hypothetical protein Q4G59_02940 [Planctomycetia bacterium]|nr:hypothetical protein [Planctomycetia bacterium]
MRQFCGMMFVLFGLLCLTSGCEKPDNVKTDSGKYVLYDYDVQDLSKFKVRDPAPKVDPNRKKLAEVYDARHGGQRFVSVPAKSSAPAVVGLSRPEDIQAAKKRITELGGKLGFGPNRLPNSVRLASSGDSGVTVDDMKLIAKLGDLESISLEGAVFDDTLTAPLAALKKLKLVSISNANITTPTLEMLSTLPELTTLELRRDLKLDDASLAVMEKMPKLETFIALYNSFTNSGMNRISKVKTLKVVDVRGCTDISDTGAKYLARLPNLEEVSFRLMITDSGVENLVAAPKLRYIEFQDCEIDMGSAEFFKQMPALKELRIFRCKSFDDMTLTEISSMPFTRLELRDIPLSNEGIASLKGKATLKSLELSELPGVDADGLVDLVSSLTGLEEMNFFFIPFSDSGMEVLAAKSPDLKSLTVRTVDLSDAGIDSILKLKKLEVLDIRENDKFSPAAMAKLGEMKSLKKLYVSGTCLTAKGNEQILRQLRQALPKCQITD